MSRYLLGNKVINPRCDETGKRMYQTKAAGVAASRQFCARRGLTVQLTVYECPHCEEWHLGNETSGKRLFAALRQDIERTENAL